MARKGRPQAPVDYRLLATDSSINAQALCGATSIATCNVYKNVYH
jgi:hypothetical protein